ncbi:MAG: lactococcin 972 family bacteriocin [Peptostreptococcaceae bacterium]|uniref:lactococcin 972 family bacteriocin n=1 Tax=Clostridium sp. TaxID=1506 RepID=UPI00290C2588|nr:lactococcin 972 family bacteriocin [Clostridium sp.]MDU6274075.1 lactococcin 972 family bacteriocin [Clostridium sp.]MDU7535453.1 lactococcin 972 family bacteriocin [Peptostreptococcaceae bacterium]
MKKSLVKTLIAMGVAVTAVPTFAASGGMEVVAEKIVRAVEKVGGGTWDYGVINGRLHSGYYHANNRHSATAESIYGTDRDVQNKGIEAYAEVKSSGSAGRNYVYWDNEPKD